MIKQVPTFARGMALLACLALSGAGCRQAAPPQAGAAAEVRLCGLPIGDPLGVELARDGPRELVRLAGETGSLRIDNSQGAAEVECDFELVGAAVAPERVFFRYGRRREPGIRLSGGPGRVQVHYPIAAHSYAVVSVEPVLRPPTDQTHWEAGGVRGTVEEGAYLLEEAGEQVVRSLGPATRVMLENTSGAETPLQLRIENTSDRLSEPVLLDLPGVRLRREEPLTLHLGGSLPVGGRGRLELRPRKLQRPFEFLFGGDVKDGLGTFVQLVEKARLAGDPLFAVWCGDYTRNSLPSEWQEYLRRTANLPFPTYPVKGNHEERCQGEAHYRLLYGPARYAFTVADLLFVVLDSNSLDPQGYHIGEEQFAWLEDQLGRHRDLPWKIIALHVPPHPLHGTGSALDAANLTPADSQRLRAIAREYSVAYVLSGHVHLYARTQENGTIYLTSAGGGALLDTYQPLPGFSFEPGPHLMLLRVGAAGIEERKIDLQPEAP